MHGFGDAEDEVAVQGSSWEALNGIQPAESDWVEKAFFADEIPEGTTVEASWLPDRHLALLCIGENKFCVTQSLNGKRKADESEEIIGYARSSTTILR